MRNHSNHRERGLTLIEMSISVVVLAGLTIVLGSVMDTGLGAYKSSSPAVVRPDPDLGEQHQDSHINSMEIFQ